ncbi:MAG: hypothetical protein MR714_03185 [Christensenellaceae bacterium]|nr:hypothetical protein [Christensenellaceae bacterium]MDD6939269.1 hypothetical protein [Christensenellaceae bacterium]MDY2748700.1 hypothetical protein [Eubacteriales bacterium]
MQYTGYIYMKFIDRTSWEDFVKNTKVGTDDKTFSFYDFVDDDKKGYQGNFLKSFEFFENGAKVSSKELSVKIGHFWNEREFEALADAFISKIGSCAVLLAYTTNLSVDKNVYMIYSVGRGKQTDYKFGKYADIQMEKDFSDMKKWLSTCCLSTEEKEFLKQFTSKRRKMTTEEK